MPPHGRVQGIDRSASRFRFGSQIEGEMGHSQSVLALVRRGLIGLAAGALDFIVLERARVKPKDRASEAMLRTVSQSRGFEFP
jgi:hypothetical protein